MSKKIDIVYGDDYLRVYCAAFLHFDVSERVIGTRSSCPYIINYKIIYTCVCAYKYQYVFLFIYFFYYYFLLLALFDLIGRVKENHIYFQDNFSFYKQTRCRISHCLLNLLYVIFIYMYRIIDAIIESLETK